MFDSSKKGLKAMLMEGPGGIGGMIKGRAVSSVQYV